HGPTQAHLTGLVDDPHAPRTQDTQDLKSRYFGWPKRLLVRGGLALDNGRKPGEFVQGRLRRRPAEQGWDHLGVRGETRVVLFGGRVLAAAAPVLELKRQQVV